MDAHLFRRFCEDLVPALVGVRIEKIHQIADGVTVFTLYGLGKLQERYNELSDVNSHANIHGESSLQKDKISLFSDKKHYLIFKEGRNPLLFISQHRPSTGEQPPAFIMRLRKHIAGRRIAKIVSKWVERKLYMQIYGGTWLCLDLRQGIELIFECPTDIFSEYTLPVNDNQESHVLTSFPSSYGIEPALSSPLFGGLWPETEKVIAWCSIDSMPLKEGVEKEIWQSYPVLTPLFRKTLPYLDKEEGAALYVDLQIGGGDIAVYVQGEAGKKKPDALGVLQHSEIFEVCPWILPQALAKKMGFGLEQSKELVFEDSISALMYVGSMLLVKLSQAIKNSAAKPLVAEAKRLDRLLQKLQKEEERFLQMIAKKELALVLQANLYSLNADEKEKQIVLEELDGKTHTIDLDPSKSIRENMEYFFHVAGRGKRGLGHLEERRINVAHQQGQALQHALEESAMQKGFESKKNTGLKKDKLPIRKRALPEKKIAVNKGSQFKVAQGESGQTRTKNAGKTQGKFPVQVQAFRSSEGFLILRGRDTKGNGLVLKMSNPHDYWVHVAEGAGAHVIIRRDHPHQEISLKTMHEAGALAILKSWQKDQDKGLVQYSLAKYIRPMRNAGAGMVHVDQSEGTFIVNVEPSLEDTLKV